MKKNQFFFTHAAVIKAADKQTRAVLSKFGAYVRRTAKGLIRQGKKPSRPGHPPKAHGKSKLKAFLFFAFDIVARAVVIGPSKLNGTISSNCPEVLEKGGRSKIREWQNHQKVTRTVTIQPRPYMGPAVAKEKKQLPALWKNSVKR